MTHIPASEQTQVSIPVDDFVLTADLTTPPNHKALVVFAHGLRGSRLSPRNRFVAEELNGAGYATLLIDFLTPEEQEIDATSGELCANIEMMTERLLATVDWVLAQPTMRNLTLGLFGAGSGAAVAVATAVERAGVVRALVSRGGSLELVPEALPKVQAPMLLIVAGNEAPAVENNRQAAERLTVEHRLEIIPDADHLLEEPENLKQVSKLSHEWFDQHLMNH